VFGISLPREKVRKRIADRLELRLKSGMIDEVEQLIKDGVSIEKLLSFGLEYKFVTLYIIGKLSYADMQSQLCTAIHQFSKRQMSWFRRMERLGVKIDWVNGEMDMEDILDNIEEKISFKN
jgi:tRNA dimethylallyltransferase